MHISPRVKSVLAHVIPFLFHHTESPQAQEQRHEKYVSKVAQMVQLDNSLGVIDPIFGLLVSPAALQGRGNVHDVECLQMAIADLAFTNAKKKHDLDGQVAALIYRALERNTEEDGARSALCTSMKAVNPEIAALQQMQDPASTGATLHNQAVVLELSRQINTVGGDPLQALDAVPEDSGDTVGFRYTCNENPCINSNNRSQFTLSNVDIIRHAVRCVATTTVTITTTVPNPVPISTTASVQTSPRGNSGRTGANTSDANSPHTSRYTPPALITNSPAPAPPNPDKSLHTFSKQRVYSQPQPEVVFLGRMPAPAIHASSDRAHTVVGENGATVTLLDAQDRS